MDLQDPRNINTKYHKQCRRNFERDKFEFKSTRFIIDDCYIGKPPCVQIGIDNLNDNIDENFLFRELNKFGEIRILEILRDKDTRKHLGLAKVQFENVSSARECIAQYNQRQLMGRQIEVFIDVRFAILEQRKTLKLNPPPPPLPSLQATSNINLNHHAPLTSSLVTVSNAIVGANALSATAIAANSTTVNNSLGILANGSASLLHPNHHTTDLSSSTSVQTLTATPSSLPQTPSILSANPALLNSPLLHKSSYSSSHQSSLDERIAGMLRTNSYLASVMPLTSNFHSQSLLRTSSNQQLIPTTTTPPPPPPPPPQVTSTTHNETTSSLLQNNSDMHHTNCNRQQTTTDSYTNRNYITDVHGNHNIHDVKRHSSPADSWNASPPMKSNSQHKEEIRLTQHQIDNEILPQAYDDFFKELRSSLESTILKQLKERLGYPCIEKFQQRFQEDQQKIKKEKEVEEAKKKQERYSDIHRRYLSKEIVRTNEPSKRVNIIRHQDFRSHAVAREPLKRINRSSALGPELERLSRQKPSVGDLSEDDESTSSRSSSSSGSRLSSPSSSSSSSSYTSSSSRSRSSSRSPSPSSRFDKDSKLETQKQSHNQEDSENESMNKNYNLEEQIAVAGLLQIHSAAPEEPNLDISTPVKQKSKKRKFEEDFPYGIASEYRSAKKFAGESIDVVMDYVDENKLDLHGEQPILYPERTEEEKLKILDNLLETLSEEDYKYLKQVHDNEYELYFDADSKTAVPFGSSHVNFIHLACKKRAIDSKVAANNPKWWKGCSRCDVIDLKEKNNQTKQENLDAMNFEDLNKAPLQASVIQPVASRRDLRGDQRRFAVFNANTLDADIIKKFTTNTLLMRAKNLRFSRSHIHKWGLFACERIANGDAVIEYVGEKIRPSLADHREKKLYPKLASHDGSSYFFRVESDVIDATLKGNKARFVNHSCNPNCIAKVIKHDNGSNSIVIYAKQTIQENEEITYDYKFQREDHLPEDQRIRCMCRAGKKCQTFLN